jgi:hypothetical protein
LIERVSIVLANWCPHCVPLSLNNAEKMAEMLGVPLRVLDIDVPEQLKEADDLVEAYGDWCEDYLIPQVFVEHDSGETRHVFTGFSEDYSVTAAGWDALFSFIERRGEFGGRNAGERPKQKSLTSFVEKHLTFRGRCRRHRDESTSLVKLSSSRDSLVGAYLCPRRVVSNVVRFDKEADVEDLKRFLESSLGRGVVRSHDLRVATRYGWELKSEAFSEIGGVSPEGVVKEVYWTTYPKTEAERSRGVFICGYEGQNGCGRLFLQEINSKNKLCPKSG